VLSKILVPLDGSELADRVLPLVRGLASRSGAEVMLVHVIADEVLAHQQVVPAANYLEAKRLALGDASKRTRYDILSGEPGARILSFAETYQPTLIALATHGRTGLSRLLQGSVTEHLLRRSRFPILAVNPFCEVEGEQPPHTQIPQKILVPLDGTVKSATIVPLVRDLALLFGATVTFLHVVEPLSMTPPESVVWANVPIDTMTQEAITLLDEPARALSAAGVKVEVLTRVGVAANEICDVARDVKADLVAMATHSPSGITRLLFGSCCEQVLHVTRVPLLAIKSAEALAS
jgi:nucleotide-binding universal stress UspA family protein